LASWIPLIGTEVAYCQTHVLGIGLPVIYTLLKTAIAVGTSDGNGKPYARIPGQNVGWLQIQDYCTGNIGGWGSHHMDIAQWAMGNAGPISVCCDKANFLTGRMFNVHHEYHILYKYANGVDLHCASRKYSGLPKGLRSNGGRQSGTRPRSVRLP